MVRGSTADLNGATKYRIELMGKPAGSILLEYRQWCTAHRTYPLVIVKDSQSLKPVGSGDSVIVKECEYLSARELNRSITGGPRRPLYLFATTMMGIVRCQRSVPKYSSHFRSSHRCGLYTR